MIARAKAEGFSVVRVTRPDSIPFAAERLRDHLDKNYHADMDWMAARADQRSSPRILWPDVKSIIMFGTSYAPAHDPLKDLEQRECGTISAYARMRDYHDVIKGRLKKIAQGLVASATDQDIDVKIFVDTAPVMEKPLAEAAGLGWQGKHTVLVSREFGSWLFLGAIFTTAELAPDEAGQNHCGTCTRCLDICPTDAFPKPYELDARRCIAYLTIEHKGPIAREFRAKIGNRIFGCDDCLAVCPWNRFAEAARDTQLAVKDRYNTPKLAELAQLDDPAFREFFAGTPVKRTGRDRFIRNVLIAIGNSGEPRLAKTARARLDDASPLVRGAAVWALEQLLSPYEFSTLRSHHLVHETDASVRGEWMAGDA